MVINGQTHYAETFLSKSRIAIAYFAISSLTSVPCLLELPGYILNRVIKEVTGVFR